MDERITKDKKMITLVDGKEYEIKTLTLKETKDILPILKELEILKTNENLTEDLLDKIVKICFIILKKSAVDLTEEKVLDLVDLANVVPIILMATGKDV
jgi:hypothetical protein